MLLQEVFNNKVDWEIVESSPELLQIVFFVDEYEYIFDAEYCDSKDMWSIGFSQHQLDDEEDFAAKYSITGTGNQFVVFATIVDIMRYFIKKYKPKEIWCYAGESNRRKLYLRMFKQLLPTWGTKLRNGMIIINKPAREK